MNHPFIAQLFFIAGERDNFAIAEEYVPHGSLLDLVRKNSQLPESEARYYFMQLVTAIEYLHSSKKVAHRDLKLENILLDAYNNIKVIDFGLSHPFTDDNQQFTTPCGSPPYLAPELISTGVCTRTTDIWSLGIVLYALTTGSIPFFHNDFSTLCHQITSKRIHYPLTLSDDLIDLLKRMLCRNPIERITIEDIKHHRWFPIEQYSIIVEASESMIRHQKIEIDSEVVEVMKSNGLDCTGLCEFVEAGEENELTILYNIYLRHKQTERMNYILRTSSLKTATVREARSMPLMGVRIPPPQDRREGHRTPDRSLTHNRFVPLDSPDQPTVVVATPRTRRPTIGPFRRPGTIHGMRPLQGIRSGLNAGEIGTP
jgi:serine/threonine protein kinase